MSTTIRKISSKKLILCFLLGLSVSLGTNLVGTESLATKRKRLVEQITVQSRTTQISALFPRGHDQCHTDPRASISMKALAHLEGDLASIKEMPTVDIFHSLDDLDYPRTHSRLFDDVKLVNLPKGRTYNYVITRDGHITYGEVVDSWEFGVKHFELANRRPIVAAGELSLDERGKVTFNLLSGTFSQTIVQTQKATNEELQNSVQSLFMWELSESHYPAPQLSHERLIPPNTPTTEERNRLCSSPYFKRNNAHLCPRKIGPKPLHA